jgi:DNA-binding MarR family transcriptional regulator
MAAAGRHAARAAEAWRLMFDFLVRSAPERTEVLRRHNLTPNDSRALFTLDKERGKPIGALAREWGSDPSTATWLVDRLERAGLAERVQSADDRRVKLVRLTVKGVATREELMSSFHQPPPEVAALPSDDLEELIRILGKLQADRKP